MDRRSLPMRKTRRSDMPKVNPKRYRTRDVAAAVGLSESLLYSFASKMKRSTRQGWTLGEIAEVLESRRVKRRKRPVSLQMVEEIRAGLICLGFRFEVTEQQVMEPEGEDGGKEQ